MTTDGCPTYKEIYRRKGVPKGWTWGKVLRNASVVISDGVMSRVPVPTTTKTHTLECGSWSAVSRHNSITMDCYTLC